MGSTSIGKKNWLFIGAAEAGKKGSPEKFSTLWRHAFPKSSKTRSEPAFSVMNIPRPQPVSRASCLSFNPSGARRWPALSRASFQQQSCRAFAKVGLPIWSLRNPVD